MFYNNQFVTLHDQTAEFSDFKDASAKAPVINKSGSLAPAVITSERYLSDRYYSKDSLFYHFLRNGSDQTMRIVTQDFFYDCVKPFLHELVISVRSLDDRTNKSVLVRNK